MTPNLKAKELFDKMCVIINSNCEHDSYCDEKECRWNGITFCKTSQSQAKQCAIICVDEILNNFGLKVDDKTFYCNYNAIQFYESVKQELLKL